jgi:hypothetical protein
LKGRHEPPRKEKNMEEFKILYHISVWTWNGMEYESHIVFESENLEEIKRKYETMSADVDHPLIELWEIIEDENKRIDYKES